MIPTREMVDDARKVHLGIPVAYVDRMRYIGRVRPRKREEGALEHYFKVPKHVAEVLDGNDWHKIWREMCKDPVGSAAALAHAAVGFGDGIIEKSVNFFRKYHPGVPMPGRILSIEKREDIDVARIEIPQKGGGSRTVEVGCKGDVRRDHKVGGAVELYEKMGKNHAYWRIKVPYITQAHAKVMGDTHYREGDHAYIDAKEVADVTRAAYGELDFCGSWTRNKEAAEGIRKNFPNMPRGLCSLYQHNISGAGILVFRGTRWSDPRDVMTNLQTMSGVESSQYRDSLSVVSLASVYSDKLILAGHSKGAGIAQYASACTGRRAVCFNSVGLPDDLLKNARHAGFSHGADHFCVKFDYVSNIAGKYHAKGMGISHPFTQNSQHLLAREKDVILLESQYSRSRVLSLHSMDTVCRCLTDDPHIINAPFSKDHRKIEDRIISVKEIARVMNPEPSLEGRSMQSRRNGAAIKSLEARVI